MVIGQKPPRKYNPWITAPQTIASGWLLPPPAPDSYPLDNCLRGKLPSENWSLPKKFSHHKISPENDFSQLNFPKRVLQVNWGKLCMGDMCYNSKIILAKVIFQDCNSGVKSDLLPYIFSYTLNNIFYKRTALSKCSWIFLPPEPNSFLVKINN